MSIQEDLFLIAQELEEKIERFRKTGITKSLDKLGKIADKFGKSWSGSWLGYHSLVYYNNFVVPPAGAHFSQEWGLDEIHGDGTVGNWKEYTFDGVVTKIYKQAGDPDLNTHKKDRKNLQESFENAKAKMLSLLSIALDSAPDDKYLVDLRQRTEKQKVFSEAEIKRIWQPKGQFFSRDTAAIEKGLKIPPHLSVLAEVNSILDPLTRCSGLAKIARWAGSHLANQERRFKKNERIGTNVFIGHGGSPIWKDLKDFIQDRLHLPWDEFNRVPIAGIMTGTRLSQMLDEAAIAFLILTAEDEQASGKLHARLNIVHEAGLFQGRLGFEKAIILLEEGCEDFSNIHGLGQIKFPKGEIRATFEDIRRVLEREGLVEERLMSENNSEGDS